MDNKLFYIPAVSQFSTEIQWHLYSILIRNSDMDCFIQFRLNFMLLVTWVLTATLTHRAYAVPKNRNAHQLLNMLTQHNGREDKLKSKENQF